MRNLRTALPACLTVVAVALGAASLTGGGAAASARTPAPAAAAPALDLLAGSYRADFGRLSVQGKPTIASKRAPDVAGKARLGRTLTVSPGTWKPAKVELTYQWFAGSKRIKGARAESYRPVDAVVGSVLSVQVTATRKGYRPGSAGSEAGMVRGGKLTASTDPVIKGVAAVGRTLKATSGGWSAAGVSRSYSWTRGGKEVGTARKYVVRDADRGKKLQVTVTATKAGYRAGSAAASTARVRS